MSDGVKRGGLFNDTRHLLYSRHAHLKPRKVRGVVVGVNLALSYYYYYYYYYYYTFLDGGFISQTAEPQPTSTKPLQDIDRKTHSYVGLQADKQN